MNKYPVIFTRGIVVFPNAKNTLIIGREKSLESMQVAVKHFNKNVIIVPQLNNSDEDPKFDQVYQYGTLCEISSIKKTLSNPVEYTIIVKGLKRIHINKMDYCTEKSTFDDTTYKSNFVVDYEPIKDVKVDKKEIVAKVDVLIQMINSCTKIKKPDDVLSVIYSSSTPQKAVDLIANTSFLRLEQKMKILSSPNVLERIDILCSEFANQKDEEKVEFDINKKMNATLSKQQREFYLRQKLATVKEELSEYSSSLKDIKKLKNKVESNPYPLPIREKALDEISRMESSMNIQEGAITRTYLDWLLDLPYWTKTEDNNDLVKVEESLNATHYGLEKVKERIIEYLAVKAKNPQSKSPIICLVGPPGVGKSSLAMSIAKALNKKFVKMSLGGVHDEAEIRGHRKTYIGAMPGKIIKGMKKVGVINPLFLLDEIDKMSSDRMHGDPASAMLEVLDPEQNTKFMDNYIEEEYDLSQVMFVATANYADQIPHALYDRLEIIDLTSYTEREKLEICKRHIIPRVLEQTGLTNSDLSFTDAGISYIINRYTCEAGVRNLERLINKIARKFIVKQLHKEITTDVIDTNNIVKYLDKEIFDYTMTEKQRIPGIVNGMAYTQAGGDLLPIEATHYSGSGKMSITGNLKETMKESASVALGYVKANAEKFGISPSDLKTLDIQMHVPAGGIPKDGPSAGVTLTTAIISTLKGVSIPSNIAMTGEITLRGRVTIVGGIKEKVISAARAGINEIFMPKDDERYLKDVPEEIKSKIKFHFVETYDEIYNELFK